jgi:hypothetical protein
MLLTSNHHRQPISLTNDLCNRLTIAAIPSTFIKKGHSQFANIGAHVAYSVSATAKDMLV